MSNFSQSFDNRCIDFCWDARTIRHRQYSAAPRYDPRHIGCYPIRLGIESGALLWDGLEFMQTMSETVTILIGAVGCMAGLKLNFYDRRWLGRSENKLCM